MPPCGAITNSYHCYLLIYEDERIRARWGVNLMNSFLLRDREQIEKKPECVCINNSARNLSRNLGLALNHEILLIYQHETCKYRSRFQCQKTHPHSSLLLLWQWKIFLTPLKQLSQVQNFPPWKPSAKFVIIFLDYYYYRMTVCTLSDLVFQVQITFHGYLSLGHEICKSLNV